MSDKDNLKRTLKAAGEWLAALVLLLVWLSLG